MADNKRFNLGPSLNVLGPDSPTPPSLPLISFELDDSSSPPVLELTITSPTDPSLSRSAEVTLPLDTDTNTFLLQPTFKNGTLTFPLNSGDSYDVNIVTATGAVNPSYRRYIAWSPDQAITAAEIAAGDFATTNDVTIPPRPAGHPDDSYIVFAIPHDALPPTQVDINHQNSNILRGFQHLLTDPQDSDSTPVSYTVDGTEYQAWVSKRPWDPDAIGVPLTIFRPYDLLGIPSTSPSGDVPNVVIDPKTNAVTPGLYTRDAWNYLLRRTTPVVNKDVSSATQLETIAAAQLTSDHPYLMAITANFTVTIDSIPFVMEAGDLALIHPRSNRPLIFYNLQDMLKVLGYRPAGHTELLPRLGRIDVTPSNIPNAAAVQRDFQVTLAQSQQVVDHLKSLGVNRVDIWFRNFGMHTTAYTPALSTVIATNVNQTEANSIGITNETVIPVRAIFRKDGDYVAEIATWLTIGGTATPSEDPASRARLDVIEAGGWVRESRLSSKLQAALVDLRARPAVRSAMAGKYDVDFSDAGIIVSSLFYEVAANGVTVIPRKQWDSPSTVSFTPTAQQLTAMQRVSTTEVIVAVTFYPDAAGIALTSHALVLPILDIPDPTPAPKKRTLVSPIVGANNAGATTLTLPADYATFDQLSLMFWETNAGRYGTNIIPIPMLAIIPNGGDIQLEMTGRANNNAVHAVWNPTTRTLNLNQDRVLYAQLRD